MPLAVQTGIGLNRVILAKILQGERECSRAVERRSFALDPVEDPVGLSKAEQAQSALAAVWAAHRLSGRRLGLGFRDLLLSATREDLTRGFDVTFAAVVAENSVVADADEFWRQDVQGKATDELPHGEGKMFNLARVPVVAIGEAHEPFVLIDRHDAPIAQGDAVGVIGKIGQDLLRPAERAFRIDYPAWFRRGGKTSAAVRGLNREADLRDGGLHVRAGGADHPGTFPGRGRQARARGRGTCAVWASASVCRPR